MIDVDLDATLDELIAALAAAGYTVHEKVTGLNDPPVVVMSAGTPYLDSDGTFGADTEVVRLELFVIFPYQDGQSVLKTAGAAVNDVTGALPVRWTVTEVSPPFLATNINRRPACRVRCWTYITTESEG